MHQIDQQENDIKKLAALLEGVENARRATQGESSTQGESIKRIVWQYVEDYVSPEGSPKGSPKDAELQSRISVEDQAIFDAAGRDIFGLAAEAGKLEALARCDLQGMKRSGSPKGKARVMGELDEEWFLLAVSSPESIAPVVAITDICAGVR